MSQKYDYDLIVIGAGSGGLVGAVGATKLGLRTALVEGRSIGGDCLNYGCVPSKSLLEAARKAKTVRKAGEAGIKVDGYSIDYEAVKARVTAVQDTIREHEDAAWFRNMGMDVIEGFGSFKDPHTVEVNGTTITGKIVLLATGSRAAPLPVKGIEEAGFVTNESVFSMPEFPKRFAIIGGGPIGTEMAWAHCQLGAEVTVFEAAPEILSKDDPEMAAVVRRSLEEDGGRVLCQSKVLSVEKTGSGKKIIYERKGAEEELEVDEILVAVGRAPNVEKLKLENAGVKYGRRGIEVNASQRTNVKYIYAIGDVIGGFMFTHSAGLQAGTFIRKAIFGLPAKTSFKGFPWCTYTDPELANVGLNESMAKKEGVPYVVARAEFRDNDRAIAEGRREGLVKVLLEPPSLFGLRGGRILGAQIVGPHAGEMIHEFALAIKAGAKAKDIMSTVHAYPTLSEINKRGISLYFGEKLFQPKTRKWLGRIFGYAGITHPGKEKAAHG